LGPAGCGKTTLAMLLAAYFRSQGKIVLICASTALAAQNYPKEGTTAHYLFKLPIEDEDLKEIDDEPIKCLLAGIPERLQLVQEADVIIWDEFPSNERACFQAVYESNDVRNLKGKVFIALGDFKQILPVGMDMQDVLDSTIIQSSYWPLFKVRHCNQTNECVILSIADINSIKACEFHHLLSNIRIRNIILPIRQNNQIKSKMTTIFPIGKHYFDNSKYYFKIIHKIKEKQNRLHRKLEINPLIFL
jgi:ABC-type oligopeptide transport system ATPase subunit